MADIPHAMSVDAETDDAAPAGNSALTPSMPAAPIDTERGPSLGAAGCGPAAVPSFGWTVRASCLAVGWSKTMVLGSATEEPAALCN